MAPNRLSILRLSRYKNILRRLQATGLTTVYSYAIAEAAGVSPAQVRKDFSVFKISGNRRGGYRIDHIIESLDSKLGRNRSHSAIIVGAGKIGTALSQYKGFEKVRIHIAAAFDVDSGKWKTRNDIPVRDIDDMETFVRENNIKIGILAVPEQAAQHVFNRMVSAGIKGVLNFAPIILKNAVPGVAITNVALEQELETLIYFAMKS